MKLDLPERGCEECGETFRPIRKRQRFCPEGQCRNRWHTKHDRTGVDMSRVLQLSDEAFETIDRLRGNDQREAFIEAALRHYDEQQRQLDDLRELDRKRQEELADG